MRSTQPAAVQIRQGVRLAGWVRRRRKGLLELIYWKRLVLFLAMEL